MKPDARIYTVAAQRAAVAPEEIFFVDDRVENVDAACSAGFDAVRFTSAADLLSHLRRRDVRLNL